MGERPLLNYTTSISPERSIGEIQKALVAIGASRISIEYAAGEPTALSFEAETFDGARSFRLPANPAACLAVLHRERGKAHVGRPDIEQATRVAWRILKDWVEAQAAIIRTEMVTIDQVMLPYMLAPNGQSLYELYRERQLPELGPGE